ncbi:MAG: serine protease [Nitrospirae bacterium]|nr:MAG: serine protease [Nitrospirota bacterium]
MEPRTVSLVLGSGGARGLAHIGVIEVLEARGYEIRAIAGTSMGAVIGGIYAAGELETYTRWVSALSRTDVLRLLDFTLSPSGLVKGDRIINVLKELIGDRSIEELPIRFTAVATDVQRQREVWLRRGSLFDAIRASIAIPTLFTPHVVGGRPLLDGGILDPVPIAATLQDETDLTIAVHLGGPPQRQLDPLPPQVEAEGRLAEYRRRIGRFIERLPWSGNGREQGEGMNFFEIVTKSTETMQNAIANLKLAVYAPDLLIQVPRNACTFLEFHRAPELIEIGRRCAERALARL